MSPVPHPPALAALALLAGVATFAARPRAATDSKEPAMPAPAITFSKLSPIIVVDAIEPCLGFWTDRLGFQKTAEVPEGDQLGFVILQKDATEVMYQSKASVQADVPAMTTLVAGQTTSLFIEVSDIAAVERAVKGLEILVPRRKTFYGADELFVRAPCGTVVGFAQFAK